jgi:hypothetical protein
MIGDFPIAAAPIAGTIEEAAAAAAAVRQPGGWLPTKPRPVILVDEYGFPYKPPVPEREPEPIMSVEEAQAIVDAMIARMEAQRQVTLKLATEQAALNNAERLLKRAMINEGNKQALAVMEMAMQEEQALIAEAIISIRAGGILEKRLPAEEVEAEPDEAEVEARLIAEALQKVAETVSTVDERVKGEKQSVEMVMQAFEASTKSMQQMIVLLANGQKEMVNAMQEMAASQRLPKQVVFDENGTPVRVETIMH